MRESEFSRDKQVKPQHESQRQSSANSAPIGQAVSGHNSTAAGVSGTGLRIISAIILSIPVIGTWAHWAVFGGEFVGELIIGRFYIAHVLIIPAILLALIAVGGLAVRDLSTRRMPRHVASHLLSGSAYGVMVPGGLALAALIVWRGP